MCVIFLYSETHPLLHFLTFNSGNVIISEIDGPVVKLELQGACGSCPSSTMTMKMGLERRLREKIPEISEVCILEGSREEKGVLCEGEK